MQSTDGSTISFAANVSPLLVPCARCHATGQEAGNTALIFPGSPDGDYAAVIPFLDTAAPSSSRLLAKMRGLGHQGGTIYAADDPEYQTVLHWIQQGARK